MRTVYKYPISNNPGHSELSIPEGGIILKTGIDQFGALVIWVEVETDNVSVPVDIWGSFTGEEIRGKNYVGTVLLNHGYVVHVYLDYQ